MMDLGKILSAALVAGVGFGILFILVELIRGTIKTVNKNIGNINKKQTKASSSHKERTKLNIDDRINLEDAIGFSVQTDALDKFEKELELEKEAYAEECRKRAAEQEEAQLNRWRKGIKQARKLITDPVPAELYAKKYNVTLDEISKLIGKGNLKGVNGEGELFVEDSPVQIEVKDKTDEELMSEYDITFDGEHYRFENYKYANFNDAIYYVKLLKKTNIPEIG